MNEGAVVETVNPLHHAGPAPKRELAMAALQVLASFAFLGGIVAFAAHFFHGPLGRAAKALVDTFGLGGIALGTFLADAFHFPVPPQFYMLAAVAHGGPMVPALVAISAGSVVGGHVAFFLSRRLTHVGFIRHGVDRVGRRMAHWFNRYGARAIVIAAILPVPYSFLCYLAGLQRLRYRVFVPVVLLRVPKIIAYFLIVRAGWS